MRKLDAELAESLFQADGEPHSKGFLSRETLDLFLLLYSVISWEQPMGTRSAQTSDGYVSTAGGLMSSYTSCIRGSKRYILMATIFTKENKNPQLA